MKISNLLINACILLIASNLAQTNATTRMATAEDFIRMRCSTDKAQDTILSWSGMSYSLEPQKQQQPLFGLFGINLADAGRITPETGSLHQENCSTTWTQKLPNHFTSGTIMDRRNSKRCSRGKRSVQFEYGTGSAPYELQGGDYATFVNTVNLFYPNPYINATLRPYANYAEYEGRSCSNFTPENEVLNASATFAPSMHFSWTRISQWLPFMNERQA